MTSIRSHLVRELVRHGFEVVPLPRRAGEPKDRELIVAFPFGMLRRVGPRGFELVEIQLDKRRVAFRLNFGIVPFDGINVVYGHVDAEEVLVGWLDRYYCLYQCPFFHMWFSVRRWLGGQVTQKHYDLLVTRVVQLIPEVELTLREGRRGHHVRLIDQSPRCSP